MTEDKSMAAADEGAVGFVATEQAGGLTSVVAGAADAESAVVMGAVADEEGILAEGAIGVQGSDAVVIARFADMDAAKEAYFSLLQAEIDGRLDIEGVLVANADAEGKVGIVKMTDHKTRNGFLAGAVAGVVVGIIFPPAILASAFWVGAGGAAIGKLRNVATRNAVARDLASVLTPGSSGIIALCRLNQVAEVEKELPKAAEVKSAPVSDEAAAAVKEAAKAAGEAPGA
jgi:uncharacterized membrane protein